MWISCPQKMDLEDYSVYCGTAFVPDDAGIGEKADGVCGKMADICC